MSDCKNSASLPAFFYADIRKSVPVTLVFFEFRRNGTSVKAGYLIQRRTLRCMLRATAMAAAVAPKMRTTTQLIQLNLCPTLCANMQKRGTSTCVWLVKWENKNKTYTASSAFTTLVNSRTYHVDNHLDARRSLQRWPRRSHQCPLNVGCCKLQAT